MNLKKMKKKIRSLKQFIKIIWIQIIFIIWTQDIL